MSLNEKTHRALKPDAQAFDEVRIVTVPRFKESELSGDEWRISASVQFFRKGQMVHETGGRDIESCCNFMGYFHAKAIDDGKALFCGEGEVCDQEGCCAPATVTYKKKFDYGRDGHKSETRHTSIRKFCERHKHRGDCGMDDADSNYEIVTPE